MRVTMRVGGRLYPLDGLPVDGLDEQSAYGICLEEERPQADPDEYVARAGEVALPLVRSRVTGSRVLLEWNWAPDFFAGEFDLEINHQGVRIWPDASHAGAVTVRTPAYKLTADDYQLMMADLSRWSTGWLAPAPGRRAGAATTRPTDSRIGALEYLIRYWPQVELLVAAVLERPRRILERESITTPLHAARTFGVAEWVGTLARPLLWTEHDGALPAGLTRLREHAGGLLPGQVPQSRVRSTLDVPENRLVRMLLDDMRQELAAVVSELRRYASRDSPARGELVARRTEQARAMLKQVTGWLRGTWLGELAAVPGGTMPTVVMLKHPVYGNLWRHYLQWKRAVVLEDGGGRTLPIERTHQLYEFWCFLTVARELAMQVGVDPEQTVAPALDRIGEVVRVHLQRDVPFELVLPGVRLTFQRPFQYGQPDLRSVSHEMRPDITLEWAGADGRPRLLLLDPKYRAGHDGVVDGLGAMHRYRDAIVDEAGRRAVVKALMLCPAPPATNGDRRYLDPAYQDEWGLGICVLRPGEGSLARLLSNLVDSNNGG